MGLIPGAPGPRFPIWDWDWRAASELASISGPDFQRSLIILKIM